MWRARAQLEQAMSSVPRSLHAALDACRSQIGYVILFSAALNLLYLAPSIYMLQVYDRVLASGGLLTLFFLTVALIAALATLAFLDAVRVRLLAVLGRRLDRLVSPGVMAAALGREGREAAGQANPIRELDTLRAAVAGPPALAVIDAPWTPIYVFVCFVIHAWIGVLAVLGGVALILIAYVNQRLMHDVMRKNEQAAGALYNLQAADSGQGEVARALGMQNALVTRQLAMRAGVSEGISQSAKTGAGYSSVTKFTRLLLQSLTLALGAFLALQQEISFGAVIAASILTTRAFAPIEMIVGSWRQFEQGRHAYGVVANVLRTQEETRTFTELPAPKGLLSLQAIVVRAPDGQRLLLQGASFTIEPGEIVGVVGPSGSGKTTLVRVACGALAPDAGVVRLDGAALTDWPPDALGRHVGYLPQDVGLFNGTVSQNIARFQTGDGIDAAVVAAANEARAHDMIQNLPLGYDTEIGPGGRGISAGQAQRIALARALFRDPVLLVLDEPNAHLDGEGETALIAALQAARARGAAVLVVAHRTGFMNIADKLMVVQNGRIDAFGPRDQVAARFAGQPGPRTVAMVGEPADSRS